ncbi:hypothetical protein C8Q73DRAFT_643336, partial [Cubamyces lactineus]
HMIYPKVNMCTDPSCPGHGHLLRLWESPKHEVFFTLSQGVYEGFAVHLNCRKCSAIYYPSYVIRDNVCEYYNGIPEFIQIAEHIYMEHTLLEHFTMLSVWDSIVLTFSHNTYI